MMIPAAVPSGMRYGESGPAIIIARIFLDDTSITDAKPFEACREGVEDYDYFVMLDKAIQEAEKKGIDKDLVSQAKILLAELPGRVAKAGTTTGQLRWKDKVDRGFGRIRRGCGFWR